MKAKHIMLSALVLGMSGGCTKEQAQNAEGSKAEVQGAAADAHVAAKLKALIPRLGGSLMVLGEHQLELAIHQSGLVEALLFDKEGKLALEPESKDLEVQLKTGGDAEPKVQLKWDPIKARFIGHADTKAALVPKPVRVTAKLEAGAKPTTGTLTEYALLPEPRFGGTMMATGDYQTELIARPDGQLQAFLTDAEGAAVQGDAKADLEASLGAEADEKVRLEWSPAHACFVGKVGHQAKLAKTPIRVALKANGKTHVGGLAGLTVTADAKHDGAMLVVGEFPVELSTQGEFLEAHVLDASGKASADADLGLRVLVGAHGQKGLTLEWNAPCACYRAKLDAGLHLGVSPIRVELSRQGRLYSGAALSLRAASEANLKAQGRLAAKAELGAEAPALEGKAQLTPGAKANLGAAANAKAKAKAAGQAAASANANAKGKLDAAAAVRIPAPKVNVKKSVSASAGSNKNGSAKAGVGASFSLGTK